MKLGIFKYKDQQYCISKISDGYILTMNNFSMKIGMNMTNDKLEYPLEMLYKGSKNGRTKQTR